MNKRLLVSVGLNFLFLGVASFLLIRRFCFSFERENPAATHSYLDNPQYAEQMKIAGAYTGTEKIIMLGDSHTYKAHWNELLNRGDIGNRGIGSDITEGYLHRLNTVFDAHPAICFIEGGVNDIYYQIPSDITIRNLSAIIDSLKTRHIIPVIHLLPPYSKDEPTAKEFNAEIRVLNRRITQLAKQKDIRCIDLYSSLSEYDYLKPPYAQNDGVHLTGPAYVIWGEKIKEALSYYGL